MYAHQVIEELKKNKNNPAFDTAKIDEVIKDIKQSKHFHFNTVESVLEVLKIKSGCSLFTGDKGEYITPPYEICWFDFAFEKNDRASKNAYLIKQVHPKWIITLYFEYNIQLDQWVSFPFSFFIGLGTSTWNLSGEELEKITKIKDLKCKISDNIIASSHYRLYSKVIADQEAYKLAKEGAHLNGYLNFALMLINCKNVNTLKNKPSDKLNKKRTKNSKQKLFTYNTLQLQLPSNHKSNPQTNDSASEHDRRLHFSRGHFKTYTEENPLFGKHTGRYWWTPQIKGNKSKGFVMKDYSINKTKI